jgi:hypothetical protein
MRPAAAVKALKKKAIFELVPFRLIFGGIPGLCGHCVAFDW